jgi:sodium pump decarboxylase gamma subunit
VSWINAWWQQISGTVAQGLEITVVGMSLVFLTLGLIILALTLLTHLPVLQAKTEKPKPKAQPAKQNLSSQATAEGAAPSSPAANDAELARVAAITVALVRSRRLATGQPSTQAASSKWKQYGRAHQLGL